MGDRGIDPASAGHQNGAAGNGQMSDVLRRAPSTVIASDIVDGTDFLGCSQCNYHQSALWAGTAILRARLRADARGLRRSRHAVAHRFRQRQGAREPVPRHPAWAKKLELTKRIVWFEGGRSPSFNHTWFIWDWRHSGPATISDGA